MQASFQASGMEPEVNDKLNSLVRLGTMASTDPRNILVDIPSGPVDFEESRLVIKS